MSQIINAHQHYHAHVYFDEASREFARQLREKVKNTYTLPVGRFNERLVGPHTMWSFSVSFTDKDFNNLIPWLDQQRNGHSILIHGVTGDDLKDHTDYADWLGDAIDLNLTIFALDK